MGVPVEDGAASRICRYQAATSVSVYVCSLILCSSSWL